MKKKRKHSEKYRSLSIGTLAVAVGAFSIQQPAVAQQEDAGRSQQARSERDSGPVQPPLEFDQQAKDILAKSAQRYQSLQSWHAEQEVVSAGRFTKKVTADFRAPQSLVVATDEAKGIKTVAYYEDGNVTTLRDFDYVQEYQVRSLNRDDAPQNATATPRSNFGEAVGPYLSSFLIGGENVFGRQSIQTVKYAGPSVVNGVAVDNITVTARKRNQPVTITYSIGREDSLLHKAVQTGFNADGTPAEYVETYSNQKAESQLPASAFKFTAPAGATKVDRFTSSRGLQVNPGDTPFAIKTKDIEGKDFSLDQYKGKVVLLDFWATWCAPCRAELPNVKAAYAKYKDQGFDIVGISFDQTIDPLKPFIRKEALGWRQIYDGYWNGPVAKAYNVRFIPSTVLIGRDGKVAAVGVRGTGLEAAIEAALTK